MYDFSHLGTVGLSGSLLHDRQAPPVWRCQPFPLTNTHPARAAQYIRFLHLCLRPWRKPPEAGYWIQGRGRSIYRLETRRQIAVHEGYARSHSPQLRDLDARPGTSSYGSTWSCPFSLTKRILFLNLHMYILLRHSICMAFQGQS